jgi:hypothetical protein
MNKYSIQARLPVNVIIEAKNKKEALQKASEAIALEYEPAGDIEIEESANIVRL